jgi:NADH:ubiquinone oxidoreductase subunit D
LFVESFYKRVDEINELLSSNRIWCQRLMNIGIVTKDEALNWGFSGVMVRASGLLWDLRVIDVYENYDLFDFSIPIGCAGDCFDRYLIRLDEMRESLNIISQCLNFLTFFTNLDDTAYIIDDYKVAPPTRGQMKISMNLLFIILSYIQKVLLFQQKKLM